MIGNKVAISTNCCCTKPSKCGSKIKLSGLSFCSNCYLVAGGSYNYNENTINTIDANGFLNIDMNHTFSLEDFGAVVSGQTVCVINQILDVTPGPNGYGFLDSSDWTNGTCSSGQNHAGTRIITCEVDFNPINNLWSVSAYVSVSDGGYMFQGTTTSATIPSGIPIHNNLTGCGACSNFNHLVSDFFGAPLPATNVLMYGGTATITK